MICQNCQANVDNDLVFCTSCGARLHETLSQTPTVLISDSVVTKMASISPPPPQKSNFKWIALIVGLIAIPCSLLAVYLLFKANNQPIAQNANQPNTPVSSPTRKAEINQNISSNVPNPNTNTVNSNVTQTNQNVNASPDFAKTEIMKERIEISAGSNYAVPFKIEDETAKIIGEIKVLQGEPLVGYVFLKEMYDLHYVDPTYKVFNFDITKDSNVNQTLVKGDYVLIFVNQTKESTAIQSNFYITK